MWRRVICRATRSASCSKRIRSTTPRPSRARVWRINDSAWPGWSAEKSGTACLEPPDVASLHPGYSTTALGELEASAPLSLQHNKESIADAPYPGVAAHGGVG